MFKKTAIAALVLSVSGVASAAMYAPAPAPTCSAGNVTVPCEKNAFDLGIQALYLRADDRARGNRGNVNWGWGLRLEGSYHYGTGNDVDLNWTWYDKKSGTNDGVVGSNYYRPRFNQVNLEFGQLVNYSSNVAVRFHGGLEFVSIKQDSRVGAGVAVNNLVLDKFEAVGPRGGADMSYTFDGGIAVFANSAVAVVTGKDKFTNGAAATVTHNTVAANIEEKLGARYTFTLAQGDLSVEAGWQMNHYSNVAGTAVAGARNSANARDFSLQGAFAGIKWVGNA